MTMHDQDIINKLITLLNQELIPYHITEATSHQRIANMIGDARLVLMGEATHGTEEFYQARMELSKYLIREKGFHAIAVEGDWTNIYSIHSYCQGNGNINYPELAFNQLKRFPTWMWRNTAMLKFIQQLREYNDQYLNKSEKIGFYGLDLYCLHEAAQAVIDYLKEHQPEAVPKAIQRYAYFYDTNFDPQHYGHLVDQHVKEACIKEVSAQLLEIYRLAYQQLSDNNNFDENEQLFYAAQNSRVVKNAEHYYRALFENHQITWNIRDQNMTDTLQNIISHIETLNGEPAKIIVWAHNSHVGDARATEMTDREEINLGQLVRERFNTSSFLLGFSTAKGNVTAANYWDGKAETKTIRPPLHGSYEWLFHQANEKNFLLDLRKDTSLTHLLKVSQLQRAIGVIYRPETERMSHYFFSRLPYQFDAIIHIDQTSELTPFYD